MPRYVQYSGIVKRTTDSAVCVKPISTTGVEILHGDQWFPRRVMLDGESLDVGDRDLEVETWFIRKNHIDLP